MSEQMIDAERQAELRLRALTRLTGRVDGAGPRGNSGAALAILYELASSPSTTGDALALLHEIQVHQVEVDLQEEELRRSRGELEARLARYVELYDLAPFAYITVDADTVICEANHAGACLLGASGSAVLGRRLDTLLALESGGALRAMLADVREGAAPRAWTLHLPTRGAPHTLHARAAAGTVDGRFLVAMVDAVAAAEVPG